MTKREFLKQLRSCLNQLNESDRDQVLLYWSEAIDDRLEAGMTEEEIFADLESPDLIALRILSELHTAANAPQPKREDPRIDELEERIYELEQLRAALEDEDEDFDEDDDLDDLEDLDDIDEDEDIDEDDDLEDLDDIEEDDDFDEDEDDSYDNGGLHFELKIPGLPEIKIPDIKIPEIKIPDIHINSEGREWYFGIGDKGAGFHQDGEESETSFKRRRLDARPESVRELRVLDHNNGIELQPSPDEQIHIRWSENANHKYLVRGEQGVLSVEHQKPGFLERLFSASRREKVVVELPAGFGGLTVLRTSNGGIEGEELSLRGELQLTSSNGSIKLEQLQAGRIALSTSNASVKLEQAQAEHIEASTSNASIKLEEIRTDSLRAVTSNSPIKAEDVDASELTLITSNGSISGELAGRAEDYTVESSTSNGSNRNPTGGSGPRHLTARTSNGPIKLEYLG